MPLAFSSLSHGTVAFGFHNIETDALLLDRLFFFCTDFCVAVCALERADTVLGARVEMPGYSFSDPQRIGDFRGAMAGVRHIGYMGDLFQRWPFPARPEDFRQRVRGEDNRAAAEEILRRWAVPSAIPLHHPSEDRYEVGPYVFSGAGYLELLAYVWRGGYPTWEGFEEGRRPECVAEMARTVNRLRALIDTLS